MDRIQLDTLPDYHPYPYAIPGAFSVQIGRGKRATKYILSSEAIEHNGILETPPFHFRSTLQKVTFPKGKPFDTPSYPYFARPIRLPYAYYVDIRKAYLQIASVWGAECYIQPERIAAYGDYTFDDELFLSSKVARGLIISGTAEKGMFTEWNGSNLSVKKFHNSLYAPHLRGAVMCTLHALFSELKRYCVYIHTDGFIVPEWYLSPTEKILSQWGLLAAIKAEGHTHVTGVGGYLVGPKSTLTYQQRKYHGIASNIRTCSQDWWKKKFIRGVEKRGKLNSLSKIN